MGKTIKLMAVIDGQDSVVGHCHPGQARILQKKGLAEWRDGKVWLKEPPAVLAKGKGFTFESGGVLIELTEKELEAVQASWGLTQRGFTIRPFCSSQVRPPGIKVALCSAQKWLTELAARKTQGHTLESIFDYTDQTIGFQDVTDTDSQFHMAIRDLQSVAIPDEALALLGEPAEVRKQLANIRGLHEIVTGRTWEEEQAAAPDITEDIWGMGEGLDPNLYRERFNPHSKRTSDSIRHAFGKQITRSMGHKTGWRFLDWPEESWVVPVPDVPERPAVGCAYQRIRDRLLRLFYDEGGRFWWDESILQDAYNNEDVRHRNAKGGYEIWSQSSIETDTRLLARLDKRIQELLASAQPHRGVQMTNGGVEAYPQFDIHRADVDQVLASVKKAALKKPSELNVLQFMERLGLTPFPVQRFVLKLATGMALDDSAKNIEITDEHRQNPRTFTEAGYLRFLHDEGRCNHAEAPEYINEMALSAGRRSGKTLLANILALHKVATLLQHDCPQAHYGFPDTNSIQVLLVFKDKVEADRQCQEGFKPFIEATLKDHVAASTQNFVRFQSRHNIDRTGRFWYLDRTGRYTTNPQAHASIQVAFRTCIAKGLRGAGNIMVILDEPAQFPHLDEVRGATFPPLRQFKRDGLGLYLGTPKNDSPNQEFNYHYRLLFNLKAESLCLEIPTWEMNPVIPASRFEEQEEANPDMFMTEYGARIPRF